MTDVAKDHQTTDPGASPSASAPADGRPAHVAPEAATGQQQRAAAGYAGRLRAVLGPVWRDRRIAAATAATVAGGYGLLAAWWTPAVRLPPRKQWRRSPSV